MNTNYKIKMQVIQILRRLIGLNQKPPQTGIGRLWRRFKCLTTVLFLCYLSLLSFPQILFGYSTNYNGITVYAKYPIPTEVLGVLDGVHHKIESSALYEPSDKFQVFICDSKALYWLMSPFARSSYAVSYPLTDNIFIARADLRANLARTYATTDTRTLSGVIAHECTHALIARRCGRQTAFTKAKWLQEGYCEYIGSSSNALFEKRGDDWIRGEWRAKGVPLDYHLWRRMVEYLVIHEKQDIHQLMITEPDYADVLAKTRNWIISLKYRLST